MAYLKPPALTRHLANPLAMRLQGRDVATLFVVGRRTGVPHKVPVIPVEVDGSHYLESPYGESEWVRNLRTAGKGELSRKAEQRASMPSRFVSTSGDPSSLGTANSPVASWARPSRSCLTRGIIRCSRSTTLRAGDPLPSKGDAPFAAHEERVGRFGTTGIALRTK
jgi:F420H(2)-dependent quinone reductase